MERRWTVIAERGEGLEVPTLAAALLADDILAGRQSRRRPRAAAALLHLEQFEPALVRSASALRQSSPSAIWRRRSTRRVMGDAFDRLPPAVQATASTSTGMQARTARAGSERGTRPGRPGAWARRCASPRGQVIAPRRFRRGRRRRALDPLSSAASLHERARARWTAESSSGSARCASPSTCRQTARRAGDASCARWSAFGVPLPLVLAPRIRRPGMGRGRPFPLRGAASQCRWSARSSNIRDGCGPWPSNRKGRPGSRTALRVNVRRYGLALRELEAAACLGAAVLLALDDARVAGQEAFALDGRAKRRLVAGQRGRDAVPDRAGLAGEAAALDRAIDVILARRSVTSNSWLMTRRSVGRAK